MNRSSVCRLALGGVVLAAPACGDDMSSQTTVATDTSGGATTGTTTAVESSSSSSGPASSSSEASTGDSTTESSSSGPGSSESLSSSGTPNTPPVADDDLYVTDTIATTNTLPFVVDAAAGLLANDTDEDGDPLMVADADAVSAAGATVDVAADGSFTYTPQAPFWGEDTFTYTVADGRGGDVSSSVRVIVAPTAQDLGEVGTADAGFRISPAAPGDHVGVSVAGGGDVNGDGFADAIVGADDVGATEEGAAYVVFGKADTDEVDLAAVGAGTGGFAILGEPSQTATGFSVGLAGDVNGDGLADVIVGAVDDAGDVGRAYVVFGKADTTAVDLAAVAGGAGGFVITDSANASAGFSVAGAGDVNGDGLADVVVGEPGADAGSGRAVVVHGRTGTTAVDLAALGATGFAIEGFGANGAAGSSVASAGDFNGDGLADVIVGAPRDGGAGVVVVVFGRVETTTVTRAALAAGNGGLIVAGAATLDDAGFAVGGAGDFNGDGRHDVLIGAPGAEGDKLNASGRAYVLFGKDDTTAVSFDELIAGTGGFAIEGEATFDLLGWSVGSAGDVDGDGLSDVTVGAQGADFGGSTSGRTYVLYGRDDGTVPTASEVAVGVGGFVVDGEGSPATAGWSAGAGGDLNGDSFADIVVGSPRLSTFSGVAHVVFGGDFGGLTPGHTAGDDLIVGTPQDDVLTGGRGADELRSEGGFDVLYGGAGDDTIVLPEASFFRIDGGLGVDTLTLDGADISLDLGNFPILAVAGIERIDITGVGDNTLFMTRLQMQAATTESPTFRVTGDAGDQLVVDLAGGSYADLGSDGTFTSYSNGVRTLEVSDAVEVFVAL